MHCVVTYYTEAHAGCCHDNAACFQSIYSFTRHYGPLSDRSYMVICDSNGMAFGVGTSCHCMVVISFHHRVQADLLHAFICISVADAFIIAPSACFPRCFVSFQYFITLARLNYVIRDVAAFMPPLYQYIPHLIQAHNICVADNAYFCNKKLRAYQSQL